MSRNQEQNPEQNKERLYHGRNFDELARLTPKQLRHLAIETGLNKLSPDQLSHLNTTQLIGLMLFNLSLEEVTHPHFDWDRLEALTLGLNFNEVTVPWWTPDHYDAHKAGLSYNTYQELNSAQVIGMLEHNLTRQQVEHPWYSAQHNRALKNGIPYEVIAGKAEIIVERILLEHFGRQAGLTALQVKDSSFSYAQLELIQSLPIDQAPLVYEVINGLSSLQCKQIYTKLRTLSPLVIKNINWARLVAVVCFGLDLQQIDKLWFEFRCLQMLKQGISYTAIANLFKEYEKNLQRNFLKKEGRVHTLFVKEESRIITDSPIILEYHQKKLFDALHYPPNLLRSLTVVQCRQVSNFVATNSRLVSHLKPYQIIAMACFDLTREQVNHKHFNPSYLTLIKQGVSYDYIKKLLEDYEAKLTMTLLISKTAEENTLPIPSLA